MRTDKIGLAYAYLRLSNEEAQGGESASITNQRIIVENYCKQHGIIGAPPTMIFSPTLHANNYIAKWLSICALVGRDSMAPLLWTQIQPLTLP